MYATASGERCLVLSAVLFDLDGTLLDIDIEPFLREYFAVLGPVVAEVIGRPGDAAFALQAVIAGTEAMSAPHPGMTNEEAFNVRFAQIAGTDLSVGEAASVVSAFYDEQFPGLRGARGPRQGAAQAVQAARDAGMKVAIATNPIFPAAAIRERLRWAGFSPEDFAVVTSYEYMRATKPHAAYFRQIAEELGVEPSACMMVGDDPVLDLSAADVGMKTFYVGPPLPVVADWAGSLSDLAKLLPRLAEPSGDDASVDTSG